MISRREVAAVSEPNRSQVVPGQPGYLAAKVLEERVDVARLVAVAGPSPAAELLVPPRVAEEEVEVRRTIHRHPGPVRKTIYIATLPFHAAAQAIFFQLNIVPANLIPKLCVCRG